MMFGRGMPLIPKISIPVVDVRDVALGHLRAMILPQAVGWYSIVILDLRC